MRRLRGEFGSLSQLVHRGFLHQFHREQRLIESHCPRVFTLQPVGATTWPEKAKELLEIKWELQLYCEAPSCWHPTSPANGGRYTTNTPQQWVATLAPWVNGIVRALKFAAPIVGPWMQMEAPEYEALLKDRIALMKGLASNLFELETELYETDFKARNRPGEVTGASLRGLRTLLDQLDPAQHWGKLKKVLTPEGHYLWLCRHHAEEFLPPKRSSGKQSAAK